MAVVATIGFFDGVHSGHRQILSSLVKAARSRGASSLVVTFWPHPRTILQQDAREFRLLTNISEKVDMIRRAGVDDVKVLTFSKEFSRMNTEQFIRDVLIGKFSVTTLLVGYDNRMGSDLLSPDETASIASSLSLEVLRCPSFEKDGVTVSSSVIRRAIAQGRMKEASSLLGYNYSISGVVVSGNRLGRTIGFPTANMQLYDPLRQLPECGVYGVKVKVLGKEYGGMTNIGVRPTVSDKSLLTIETNIFDFDEDIYGLDISVEFIDRVRDERHFPSVAALSEQLAGDREFIRREILGRRIHK
ncbi:MAG: riboflavin biosynthesis protein RibF [Bacteroidales bacterium]|nr:riboflavin biosynthesis protein RibF [Bacteroidales bacterium]